MELTTKEQIELEMDKLIQANPNPKAKSVALNTAHKDKKLVKEGYQIFFFNDIEINTMYLSEYFWIDNVI